MTSTAMPRSRDLGTFLSVAKSRRTPVSMSENTAGSSGVSLPSGVARRQRNASLPSVFGFLAAALLRAEGRWISGRCRTGSLRTLSKSLGGSLPSLRSRFARTGKSSFLRRKRFGNFQEADENELEPIAFPLRPASGRLPLAKRRPRHQ